MHKINYGFINNWTNDDFKKLWTEYESKLKIVKYKENLNLNNLDIIEKYVNIFKSKSDNFEDFIVNDFKILFQKL